MLHAPGSVKVKSYCVESQLSDSKVKMRWLHTIIGMSGSLLQDRTGALLPDGRHPEAPGDCAPHRPWLRQGVHILDIHD